MDEYLLGDTAQRIKDLGMEGWKLRWRVMQTPAIQKRFREERKALGLPEEPEDVGLLVGSDGSIITHQQLEEEIAAYDRRLDVDDREDGVKDVQEMADDVARAAVAEGIDAVHETERNAEERAEEADGTSTIGKRRQWEGEAKRGSQEWLALRRERRQSRLTDRSISE